MLAPGDYYAGRTILLTGATGLVGRAVLETLLRTLPEVRRIHALVRPRWTAEGERVAPEVTLEREILGNSAFNALREHHGDAFDDFVAQRVAAVAGDVSRPGLDLDPADRQRLAGEVDLVINCAALAVFDAPLDQALQSNALGPLHVLEFAREVPNPPFIAHVSTCYVNNLAGPVFETTPVPDASDPHDPGGRFDADDEIEALRRRVQEVEQNGPQDPDQRRQQLVATGLERARSRGWNDTYTFTKALGEQLFVRHRGDIPGLILRPAIIESALAHPAPGWIDGFRMVDPLIVGFARGQIFEFPGHPDSVLDVIPGDRVVNALLMAIPWCHRDGGPEVFQVASGMENPLRIGELRDYLHDYFERAPLRHAPGGAKPRPLPDLTFPPTARFLASLQRRYLRPLRLLMRLTAPLRWTTWGRHQHATFSGRHGRLKRLHDMAAIYGPYAQSRVRYMSCNTSALAQRMSTEERARFPCTAGDFAWRSYVQEAHIPGIERYLLRMRRAAPRTPTGTASAAGGEGAEVVAEHWHKAQRLLAATRTTDPDAVRTWTRPGRARPLQRASAAVLRGVCRTYLRLGVEGGEHLPERGPYIVVSNHCSHADTTVLLAAVGPQAVQLHPTAASDYWFRSRLLGWVLHGTLGAVPFDRHAKSVPRALALPTEMLRAGESLVFYPEGTRSPDGRLQRFGSTVGLLALAAAVPVVPAYIEGTSQVLPKGRFVPRPHRVRVTFGQPLGPDAYLRRLAAEHLAHVARDLAADSQAAVAALAPPDLVVESMAQASSAVSDRMR